MAYAGNKRREVDAIRPQKCRRVCCMPSTVGFTPVCTGGRSCGQRVIWMTVDEYEAIRLIDREGLSQEQCGQRMKVARTTVQQIYTAARKKLADALVEGVPLKIGGGNYRLCGGEEFCGHGGCRRRCGETADEKQEE